MIRENVERAKVGDKVEIVHKSEAVKSTKTTIPFVKNNNFDYADLVGFLGEHKQGCRLGGVCADGHYCDHCRVERRQSQRRNGRQAAGNSAFICIALGILAYVSSHIEYASYLNIMFVPGSQELVIFISATVGALIGFLWYNAYPAQVFMGDTGSLTVGAHSVIGHYSSTKNCSFRCSAEFSSSKV